MNTETTQTPRTDEAEYHPIADNYAYCVDADFARSLERELAQARALARADCANLSDRLSGAELQRDELGAEAERLRAALEFYADPDTYFAFSFVVDRPCGEFETDFSEGHGGDYERKMPGKRARAALNPPVAPEPEPINYTHSE